MTQNSWVLGKSLLLPQARGQQKGQGLGWIQVPHLQEQSTVKVGKFTAGFSISFF